MLPNQNMSWNVAKCYQFVIFQNLVKISQKHREYATRILLCFAFMQDFIEKEEGCFYAWNPIYAFLNFNSHC